MKKILIGLLIGSSLLVAAGKNINGMTGYVAMPTGEGARFQEYTLGLGAFSGTEEMKQHWKFNSGLGISEGAEISFMGRSEREGFFLNTKWFGSLGNYSDPLLVGIGFENISSLGTYGDYPSMFMVVTKKFMGSNSISIGSTGRYINREVKASMLFGGEFFASESFSWLGDFASYEDNRYNFNAGLRVYSNASTYFHLYVLNAIRTNVDQDMHPVVATIGITMNGFM
jgi:hypothetical protein